MMFAYIVAVDLPSSILDCANPIFTSDSFALSCAVDFSEYIAHSWDDVWADIIGIGDGLYAALNNISKLIAAFSFVFMLIKWMREILEEKYFFFSSQIIWPLVVIICLHNNGAILRDFSFEVRNVINGLNNEVLVVVNRSLEFEEKFNEISDYVVSDRYLKTFRSQCNGITDNEMLIACLDRAIEKSEEILDTYRTKHGSTDFFEKISNYRESTMEDLSQNPVIGLNKFAPLTNNLLEQVIEKLLVAFQGAFQQVVELSMLLSALLAPLFLGASLLHVPGRPIIMWFTAYLSVGIAKLSFNIVTAVIVSEVYAAGMVDPLGNLLLMTIFSPMLALALAAGGGMAIFSGTVSTAASVLAFGLPRLSFKK